MSKRKHGESAPGDITDLAPSKRRSSSSLNEAEALQILRRNSNELADCLKSLEKPSALGLQQLASLSKKLLPAIQYLSGSTDKPTESTEVASIEASSIAQSSIQTQMPVGYIPQLGSLRAWTVSDIPKKRPPLPPISDPVLEKAALTHPAVVSGLSMLNYEVLEFLGDAFIYHVASELISQTFPKLTPGKCTQIRELLVRNLTLASYSEHYGLNRRALFPDELLEGGPLKGAAATKDKRTKTLGDIFEAYVGALIHSGPEGPSKAVAWLRPLWALTIADEIRRVDRQNASIASRPEIATTNGEVRSFKQQLALLISVPGVKINYHEVPNKQKNSNNMPLFSMTVNVEGYGAPEQFLAKGSGLSKKDAGDKAAEMALENKKAMKELAAKKQEYMARKAALSV